MNRIQASVGLLALSAGVAGGAFALKGRVIPMDAGWNKVPAITVISAAGDPRVPVVEEAIAFWNRTLEELGTPFRLGAIVQEVGRVPDAEIEALSAQMLDRRWFRGRPKGLDRFSGDLLIVLSDASFISFTAPAGERTLVAIKSERLFPLNLPNVLRNVIAHELGHAIGLEHNADPAMLMCGRPAECRPQSFQSESARFFPLTSQDRARLLWLYPRDWREGNRGESE